MKKKLDAKNWFAVELKDLKTGDSLMRWRIFRAREGDFVPLCPCPGAHDSEDDAWACPHLRDKGSFDSAGGVEEVSGTEDQEAPAFHQGLALRARLLELLADDEHARWSRWMDYLFSLECGQEIILEGKPVFVINAEKYERWKRQAATPYNELSEGEKDSDRREAASTLNVLRSAGVDV